MEMNSNGEERIFLEKKMKIYISIGLVSMGYFFNGNLMIWLSRLFFFGCPWLCLERRFTPMYFIYVVLPFLILLFIIPAFLYRNVNRFNMKWFFYYAAFLLIGSWITILLFGHVIPEVLVCLCLSANIGIAVGTLHFLIPIYIYDLTGGTNKRNKLKIDAILAAQFAAGILFQFVISSMELFDDLSLWLTISPIIVFLVGLCFTPTSVRYLCIIGKPHEAKAILNKNRWTDVEIEEDIDCWLNDKDVKWFITDQPNRGHLRRFSSMLGLTCLEQLLGPVIIQFYLHEIIFTISPSSEAGLFELTAVGFSYFLGCCMANKLHSTWAVGCDYRRILYVMLSLMAILLFAISGYVHYTLSRGHMGMLNDYHDIIPIFLLCTLMLVYAVGIRYSIAVFEEKLVQPNETLIFKMINTVTYWSTVALLIVVLLFNWRSIGLAWFLTFFAIFNLLTIFYVLYAINEYDNATNNNGAGGNGTNNQEIELVATTQV